MSDKHFRLVTEMNDLYREAGKLCGSMQCLAEHMLGDRPGLYEQLLATYDKARDEARITTQEAMSEQTRHAAIAVLANTLIK